MSSEQHRAAEVNRHLTVGEVECFVVSDGSFAYADPSRAFFANADREELRPALERHGFDADAWDTYVSPYPCLVVRTDDRTVLVDTGAGDELGDHTGKLRSNLGAMGIDPDDVDTVLVTHVHPDHVGGNLTDDGTRAFPNAEYLVSDSEFEFWSNDPDLSSLQVPEHVTEAMVAVAENQVRPLADELRRLPETSTEIAPGVRTIPAPGHTPGHLAVEVRSAGETLLHLVDLVLLPTHVEHPEWCAAFDLDPETLAASRRRLLGRAADEQALVLAHHFPAPGLGRVRRTESGFEWEPLADSVE